MPLFKMETNVVIDDDKIDECLKKISGFVSKILNKPEKYIMVLINNNVPVMFAETSDPAAYIVLKSIGLTGETCPLLSEKICEFLESEYLISADRVYIDFQNINGAMFGWNKVTF